MFQQLTPFSPTCGDMIFSGYSVCYVLCHDAVAHLLPPSTWSKPQFGSSPFVSSSCSLESGLRPLITLPHFYQFLSSFKFRMHYTLDVVMAVFLTISIWSGFHRMVLDCRLKRPNLGVWWIDSVIIYPIINWFETHSGI